MSDAPGLPGETLAEPGAGWFHDHHDRAAQELIEFFAADGITLEGKRVADLGCGDGIIDLGLARHGAPGELVGFDVVPTDTEGLIARARGFGAAQELPPNLSFQTSTATRIPAPDRSFDIVVTWSAFEHIGNPAAVLTEARRILRDDGILFLQLWPFFHSDRGSHLWEWCPEPYHHLVETPAETEQRVRESGRHPEFAEMMLREFHGLNRITLDDLGAALLAGGLGVRKLDVQTVSTHIPAGALRHPLSALAISGVKLLATPLNHSERVLLRRGSPAARIPYSLSRARVARVLRRLLRRPPRE